MRKTAKRESTRSKEERIGLTKNDIVSKGGEKQKVFKCNRM